MVFSSLPCLGGVIGVLEGEFSTQYFYDSGGGGGKGAYTSHTPLVVHTSFRSFTIFR